MRFTSFFSLIAACALFASANGATVRGDLTGEFSEKNPLHGADAEVHEALLVRDVNVARATPTIIKYVLILDFIRASLSFSSEQIRHRENQERSRHFEKARQQAHHCAKNQREGKEAA